MGKAVDATKQGVVYGYEKSKVLGEKIADGTVTLGHKVKEGIVIGYVEQSHSGKDRRGDKERLREHEAVHRQRLRRQEEERLLRSRQPAALAAQVTPPVLGCPLVIIAGVCPSLYL